ncbi:MAG TPA: DUF2927 domain-containing protein [Symbiobacteriaceae bacterium]|nr:DUF2927 domain-containing protein [Symbiobacteriaceae bacterium]
MSAPNRKEETLSEETRVTAPESSEDLDADVLDYLDEVALNGFEFGSAPRVVYKWTQNIGVSVSGAASESDRLALKSVLADLNELISPLRITQVAADGDITIYYGPDTEFSRRLTGYTPGNRGYFEVHYSRRYSLQHADVVISTAVDAAARAHLLREELTQSLGMFQDSWHQKESIFYQGWTTTDRYSDLDKAVIRTLYDSRIKPGMTRDKVRDALGA